MPILGLGTANTGVRLQTELLRWARPPSRGIIRFVTRNFVSRARLPGQHPVEYFWSLLDQLGEDDYPPGVAKVPFPAVGTWAFSAGTGLYCYHGDPLPKFPEGGVMLVGHNGNSVDSYERLRGVRGDPDHPTMRTWRGLKDLLGRANVDRSQIFFTNIYVGLKEGADPSGPFPGRTDKSFCDWCEKFLDEQVRVMRPSVVVALGGPPQAKLKCPAQTVIRRKMAAIEVTMVGLLHTSSPRYYERIDDHRQRIDLEAELLKQALLSAAAHA